MRRRALAALAARRLAREPVARILGRKEFWGLRFGSTARRWCRGRKPRPWSRRRWPRSTRRPRDRALRIADLGTGSGALLLALLHELPNATGIGTDISRDALATARRQRRTASALALARNSSPAISARRSTGPFDLVVSNPPYIASGDIAGLPPEVRHDPRGALDGGADGLDCYRTIAATGARLARAIGPSGGRAWHRSGTGGCCAVPRGRACARAGASRSGRYPAGAVGACCHNDAMTPEH